MALRDWHGWHIGMLWGVGVAFLWLLGRIGETMSRAGGIGPRIAVTAVILLILVGLLVITIRWFRARLLDE
jgi:hypothetical protein